MSNAAPMELGMTNNMAPGLVSVIIPTYNRDWAIDRCLRSVFAQNRLPVECLVVDDGSTDNTAEVVRNLAQSAPEGVTVRYFRKENGGANSARNRGLIESRGEFICFLDSDDWLLPDSIGLRADVLAADTAVGLCYGLCSIRDDSGHELRRMNTPWPSPDRARIVPYLFDTNSPLIRRSLCAKAGLWREDDMSGQEYEYFARIKFFSSEAVFLDQVLSVYVRHDRQNVFDISNPGFLLAIVRMLWAIKALVMYSRLDTVEERRALADEFHKVAKQLYRVGHYTEASMAIKESLMLSWTLRRFLQQCCIQALGSFSVVRRMRPGSSHVAR